MENGGLDNELEHSKKMRKLKVEGAGSKIRKVDLAVTYKCNSRCYMCNDWNRKSSNEMKPDEIIGIFRDDVFSEMETLKVTGGEPTLRGDIVYMIREIRKIRPNIIVGVNTHGMDTEKTESFAENCLGDNGQLDVRISLDGIGEVHDMVRGVKGAYKKASSTIEMLKSLKRKHSGLTYGLSVTLTPINHSQLQPIFARFSGDNIRISYRFASNSHVYHSSDMEFQYDDDIERTLEWIEENSDNFFASSLPLWFRHKERPVECFNGIENCYIDPKGNIYPCIYKESFGNVRNGDVGDVWSSKEADKKRYEISGCRDCWTECQSWVDIKADYFAERSWRGSR